ncbi:MAG: hypothetical protein ACOCZ6_02000 [Nanoarchaeota archaeon]
MKKYLILVLLLVMFMISGCEEPECEKVADCPVEECFEYDCVEGECEKTTIDDCCGNNICEEDYDQNYCNCPEDCTPETCEGKIVLDEELDETTKYLKEMCMDDECTVYFDKDKQRTVPLNYRAYDGFFELGVDVEFKRPTELNEDEIEVKITLEDIDDDLVMPLKIRSVELTDGDRIYGEDTTTKEFENLDDSVNFSFPVTYIPDEMEAEEHLSMVIRFEKEYSTSDDETTTERDNTDESLADPIYIVNPGDAR